MTVIDKMGTKISVFDWKTWKCRNKTFKWFKSVSEHSGCMDNVYNNISGYNPSRQRNILIVFGNMIADNMTNKKNILP